jgi:hypothetical protein
MLTWVRIVDTAAPVVLLCRRQHWMVEVEEAAALERPQ